MNSIKFRKNFALLAFFLFALVPGAQAQQSASSPTENNGLTQGQAALIIANRLGLSAGSTITQKQAIQLLIARGITPKGGWDADAPMKSGEVAVVLVQALGIEDQLSESQIESKDTQSYNDLLEANFGVDVSEIVNSNDLASNLKDAPLNQQDTTLKTSTQTPFTRQNLNFVMNALVGGGSSTSVETSSRSTP